MNHLYGSNRPLKASLSPHYERAGALATQNKDNNSMMMRTALVNAKIELSQLMQIDYRPGKQVKPTSGKNRIRIHNSRNNKVSQHHTLIVNMNKRLRLQSANRTSKEGGRAVGLLLKPTEYDSEEDGAMHNDTPVSIQLGSHRQSNNLNEDLEA